MPDNRFDGHRVSTSWDIALTHARRMGVHFELDSGRRTMAEQWTLWRNYRKYGKPVAAFPLPTAPHIRVGKQAHAIDVNSLDGGETGCSGSSRRRGCIRRTRCAARRGTWSSLSRASPVRADGPRSPEEGRSLMTVQRTLAGEVQRRPPVGGHRSPAVHVEAVGEEQGRARAPPPPGRLRAPRAEAPPAGGPEPAKGLDVSNLQGSIDWRKVKDAGYRFVWIKAGEGDWKDPTSSTTSGARRLRAEGRRLPVPASEAGPHGRQEAAYFIERLEAADLGKGDLRPVLDVEATSSTGPGRMRT
jgi:hypothetical protein